VKPKADGKAACRFKYLDNFQKNGEDGKAYWERQQTGCRGNRRASLEAATFSLERFSIG